MSHESASDRRSCDDLLYLFGNDVSCRAPLLKGNDVLVNDKHNRFTTVDLARYVDFRSADGQDKARTMFGDLLDDDGWYR